jgi:hypothetical protein
MARPVTRGSQALGILLALVLLGSIIVGTILLIDWVNARNRATRAADEAARQTIHRTMAYMEVAGECAEDHAKLFASYQGSIEHWRHAPTNEEHISGYVRRPWEEGRWIEERQRPYCYHPPDSIHFSDLTPEDLTGDTLRLAGSSSGPDNYQYESSCVLRVLRRLDHNPEREAWEHEYVKIREVERHRPSRQ